MTKTSAEYWSERESAWEKKNKNNDEKQIKKIQKIYAEQSATIEKEVLAFYSRYATENGLDIAEVKKKCSLLDIEEYSKRAAEYVKNKDFSKQANEDLAIYNLTMKTSRLELLKANVNLALAEYGTKAEQEAAKALYGAVKGEFERQSGFMGKYIPNTKQSAEATINASFHAGTFSSRIWGHQQALRNQLDKIISSGLIQGKNPLDYVKAIQERHNVTAAQASRLLRTEFTRVRSQAKLDSLISSGVDEFIIVTGNGEQTCSECGSKNGEHYKVKDGRVGDNIPPFHPNCRCSIAPYIDRKVFEDWADSESDLDFDEYGKYGKLADQVITTEKKMAQNKSEIKDIENRLNVLNPDYEKAIKNIKRCKNGSELYNKYNSIIDEYNTLTSKKKQLQSSELATEYKKQKSELLEKRIAEFVRRGEQYSPNASITGIWRDPVTLKDVLKMSVEKIQAKKDYYIEQNSPTLDRLEEILRRAEAYRPIAEIITSFQIELNDLGVSGAYSQTRKDAAYWFSSAADADRVLRPKLSEVWVDASKRERQAIYDYTETFSRINEPLRGIEYGTSVYKGVGNIDFDTIGIEYRGYKKGEIRDKIQAMTEIIDKCSYDHDMWFTRGCRWGGMDKFFNCDMDLLQNGTTEELQAELLGGNVIEYGFMSTGVAKGKGFGGNIVLNVYAPKGAHYIWAEPFSTYGYGDCSPNWDGVSPQSSYSGESEAVFQRGSVFRISKIYREGQKIYVDLDWLSDKEGPDV